jgi:hypothetical protein
VASPWLRDGSSDVGSAKYNRIDPSPLRCLSHDRFVVAEGGHCAMPDGLLAVTLILLVIDEREAAEP